MKRHPITQMFITLFLLTLAGGSWADSHKKNSDDDAKKVAKVAPPMIYIPPKRDAPRTRVGGATRGAGVQAPTIDVIAPESVGLTLTGDPVLYWFLPEINDNKVGLRVSSSQSDEPLLKAALPTPKTAGIQRVRLADHGLTLQNDVDYHWFIAIPGDVEAHERDQFAGGGIIRIDAPIDLAAKLDAAGNNRANVLADAGIWYDTIDALSQQIDADPKNAELVRARAELLTQVGLDKAAEFERARADKI
ncbi:MAG: DUF928 domain-containing protein [Deltaproteobacteria bacterium]|nr:DUF928 domain-containing protein [Deltaproteobacteria bacterium]MBW2399509.1 DUF928 domain-containing protein [Deltaproteobacteria bacterium]MBW2665242.1 DUF928 domain-containing protein [Deltaproteobacteria bacterium]